MDKDFTFSKTFIQVFYVSTLVLMDSWIKTSACHIGLAELACFNPCFNGFMDKDALPREWQKRRYLFQPLF